MPKISSVVKSEHVVKKTAAPLVAARILEEKNEEKALPKKKIRRDVPISIAPRDGLVDTSTVPDREFENENRPVQDIAQPIVTVFGALVNLGGFVFRPKLVIFVSSTVSLFLLVSYLYEINNFTTKGYEVRKLQKEVLDLRAENKKLQVSLSEATAIGRLRESPETFEFVTVDPTEVKFLTQ